MTELDQTAIVLNSDTAVPDVVEDGIEASGVPVISIERDQVGDEELLDFIVTQRSDITVHDIGPPFRKSLRDDLRLRADPRSDKSDWLAHSTNRDVVTRLENAGENVELDRPLNTRILAARVRDILEERAAPVLPTVWRRLRSFFRPAA